MIRQSAPSIPVFRPPPRSSNRSSSRSWNCFAGSILPGYRPRKRYSWASEFTILKGDHAVKNAKELLEDFVEASWRDPEVIVSMFTEDGGLELPYLTDFGLPGRFAGAEGISGAAKFLHDTFPGLHLENLKILIDTPDQVFAEYEFTNVSTITGRKVHQLFFGRLV